MWCKIDGGIGYSFTSQGPSGTLVLVLGIMYTYSESIHKSDSHFGLSYTFGGGVGVFWDTNRKLPKGGFGKRGQIN